MLEVGIQTFFRIQFGTVARQVEEFDLVLAPSHPRLDRFAVMHPEVVKNQERIFSGVLDQCCYELNEFAGVEGIVDDHPAGLALIRDRGNH